ncbi:ATP-binding cassette domain-containing protein [Rubrobacter indicoceani]|uniref:ATP-binding cassette domain-containing protein n=1 Tax=Rubrobacter indicoceani TaxID=2051957 RepID=UPI000E5BF053|nr:ATP-binding cassette domain-containing protein [Rubrobacter indicoceani]
MNEGEKTRSGPEPDGSFVVSLRDATFLYPGSEGPAVSDISLGVRAGEYVGVVGANGGGKSTLVRLLNGLLAADSGEVRIFGLDPVVDVHRVRRRVGMLFQNPDNGLVAPFVQDDVAFGLENLGVERDEMRSRVAEAIGSVGLSGYERRETATLSGGEKQRVALAGLLAVEPDLLILDEPTSMLDPAGRREVLLRLDALRGEKTIVHVTHHLEELVDADRVIVLVRGELVADVSPDELFSDAGLMQKASLAPPVLVRLATELGLSPSRTAGELARNILNRRSRA